MKPTGSKRWQHHHYSKLYCTHLKLFLCQVWNMYLRYAGKSDDFQDVNLWTYVLNHVSTDCSLVKFKVMNNMIGLRKHTLRSGDMLKIVNILMACFTWDAVNEDIVTMNNKLLLFWDRNLLLDTCTFLCQEEQSEGAWERTKWKLTWVLSV